MRTEVRIEFGRLCILFDLLLLHVVDNVDHDQ